MQACQWRDLSSRSSCALFVGPRRVETAFEDVKGALQVSNLPQAASWQPEAASTAAKGPPQKLFFESTNDQSDAAGIDAL